MGLIFKLIKLVVALAVILAAIGAIMYYTDTPVKADIVDQRCSIGGASSEVDIVTKFPIPGIEYTLIDFDDAQCAALEAEPGESYAEYYLKSGRVVMYGSEGGNCIYDSASGIGC